MSGAVFHPGHDDLHGMTVVVYTSGPMTVVGRWDATRAGMVYLNDCALHEEGGEQSKDEFVQAQKTYGVAVAHKSLTVPEASVQKVVMLRDA